MAIAKMDLAERGLGAKRAHANHSQYDFMAGSVCVHMGRGDQVCVRVQACGASHTLARRRGTELVVARSARAGIEPAPPGSCTRLPPANAEGSTLCLRG